MTLVISQTLLWIVVGVLSLAVLALARQLGVLYERIAPVGALAVSQGPQPGQASPVIHAKLLTGETFSVGLPRENGRPLLLFFVSPTCPICRQLLPTARVFAEDEGLDLLLVGDGDLSQYQAMAKSYKVRDDELILSADVGRAFQIGKLPSAVLLDPRGVVVAQGLVNNREHLESLITAGETGFASVQQYLDAKRADRTPEPERKPANV
mgnify:CR=1 FL=1|tara:strand:- start:67881 stop:68507 length:627 start_codon:yes stop_codon:yes gene_type:complete